jgi:hypothetical protein
MHRRKLSGSREAYSRMPIKAPVNWPFYRARVNALNEMRYRLWVLNGPEIGLQVLLNTVRVYNVRGYVELGYRESRESE